MTAREMFLKALQLLGYGNAPRFTAKAINVINQVYSDIWYCVSDDDFTPIENLTEKINLNARILHDIMPYGVAAFIAQAESDGDNQQYFARLYNRKRAGINRMLHIVDTIPAPEGE